jgi:hypothetical protein
MTATSTGKENQMLTPASPLKGEAVSLSPQKPPASPPRQSDDVCPECGSLMEPNGRCFVCRACGYSRCG